MSRFSADLAASWARSRASGDQLGAVLGRLGGLLEPSWHDLAAVLGRPWGVLGCLGASWGRLGLDFRSNGEVDSGISSRMPFSNRYPPDFVTKNRSPILEESLNSIGKICIFCFQALLG